MTIWETPTEAAERTRQSVPNIRNAVRDGDLPSYRVGASGSRNYVLKASEVDAWMESRPYEPRKTA